MSTTTTLGAGNGQATGLEQLDHRPAKRLRGRRNWPRVGAAAALAIVCGALFVLLYGSAGSRHPVLAVAQPVAAGTPITASDLTTVRVTDDPALAPVPATEAGAVVGRRAAVALVPGTILTPADLASGPVITAGQASVGLDLKPGQVPSGLEPGESVLVVETASPGQGAASTSAASGTPTILVDQAIVLSVAEPSASSGSPDTRVTLVVPADLAAEVVAAASADQIALAGLGPSGGS